MNLPCREPLITGDTPIEEVLRKHRRCLLVFKRYGLSCPRCAVLKYETIGQLARAKGIDLHTLLMELNIAAGLVGSNVATLSPAPRSPS
ncbi:hypothetical protein DRP77_07800 [Candidatus Poribacteria bacterium]|nr:MAG: hypothetical protein DRP77_07800 [Candidatus Poribacteria bacterium]